MIRNALVALGPKTMAAGVLIGSAALALGALFLPTRSVASAPAMYRLVLHAPEVPGYMYVSAWAEGDVFVPRADDKTITFVRRGDEHDGCTWQGTETLTRLSAGVYAYDYREAILACKPDANPFRKTPRSGIVTVERWNGPATATALNAVQAPGNLWNVSQNDCADDDDMNVVAEDDSDDADDDAEQAMADAQRELADAQRELADAQQEVADAIAQANDQVKAAVANDRDDEE